MTLTAVELPYPFTEQDARAAYDEWGANCGPTALAVCLGKTLDDVRPALASVDFESKRYTSPSMMQAAIHAMRARITRHSMVWAKHGLVRIQWTGPWTALGANPRWAYRQTHWVHSRWSDVAKVYVFDCNGGWRTLDSWREEIVPLITASIKRADGGWRITHSWEIGFQAQGAR